MTKTFTLWIGLVVLAFASGFGLGFWRSEPVEPGGGSKVGATLVLQKGSVDGKSRGGVLFQVDGKTEMALRADGTVYVHGVRVGEDKRVVEGLREWLQTAHVDAESAPDGGSGSIGGPGAAEVLHDH